MSNIRFPFALATLLWLSQPILAQVISLNINKTDFNDTKAGNTWSPIFKLEGRYLVAEARKKVGDTPSVWVQTGKMPVNWAPQNGLKVSFEIDGGPESLTPEQLRAWPPPRVVSDLPVDVYVRYGCDGEHWSSWIPMERSSQPIGFTSRLKLPKVAQEKYSELRAKWKKTDPDVISEENACRWIAKTHPDFFKSEIPFIGYVQFRAEWNVWTYDKRTLVTNLRASWMELGNKEEILRMNPSKLESFMRSQKKWSFELSKP